MYNCAISKKVNDTKGGMEAWIIGQKYKAFVNGMYQAFIQKMACTKLSFRSFQLEDSLNLTLSGQPQQINSYNAQTMILE